MYIFAIMQTWRPCNLVDTLGLLALRYSAITIYLQKNPNYITNRSCVDNDVGDAFSLRNTSGRCGYRTLGGLVSVLLQQL